MNVLLEYFSISIIQVLIWSRKYFITTWLYVILDNLSFKNDDYNMLIPMLCCGYPHVIMNAYDIGHPMPAVVVYVARTCMRMCILTVTVSPCKDS